MSQLSQLSASIDATSAKTKLKRLLLVSDRLPSGKTDYDSLFLADFVTALEKRGVKPELFTPFLTGKQSQLPIPVFGIESSQNTLDRKWSTLRAFRTSSEIKNQILTAKTAIIERLPVSEYDHILAVGALTAGCIAKEVSAASGVPFSTWCLGIDINMWVRRPFVGRIIRQSLRAASALFANGDELADRVTTISDRECLFLPCMHRFTYQMKLMRREKFFLYVGSLDKRKGIYDLIKAFKRIKDDIWDYRLLIIGSGPEKENIKKEISTIQLRGKVHLVGDVTNEELINYLQRTQALIIPTHSDSLPQEFGEALQTKTPMVVTNVGDLGTLVRDNALGIAIQKRSVRKLTDAMVRMIVNDFDLRESAPRLLEHLAPEKAVEIFLNKINIPMK